MNLITFVTTILSLGTIASQLCIAAALAYLVCRKSYPAIGKFIGANGLLLVFLVSLISMASSLFYSQIAAFPPCELCWYQRIFMYPLVAITAIALVKKDKKITDYILWLSGIGAAISVYHNYIYYFNSGLDSFCQIGGNSVSCVKRYIFAFGYITIPMMALTAFLLIIIIMVFVKLYEQRQQ